METGSKTARDVMTAQVLTVAPGMSTEELASFLIDHEVSGAAVVEDSTGRLLGVVSVVDLAAAAATDGAGVVRSAARPDYFVRGWEEAFDGDELLELDIREEGPSVGDIMRPPTYTVAEETPVPEIARMMLDGHLHRVLVTRDGELAGIVTTSDLLTLLV